MINVIGELDNLYAGFLKTRRSKRHKPTVFKFENRLGAQLEKLSEELMSGAYKVTPPKLFDIKCTGSGKVRNISAPAFRDSVMQHAIYAHVYPIFDRGFIYDNYGCRIAKGTHSAADRCQEFLRQHPEDLYYLQMDIRRFYYSINHSILRQSLFRKLKCDTLVDLMMQFVDTAKKIGLNVGNLLAQLFGIVYLDRFDHWVKRALKQRHYLRYVDDMLIIGLTYQQAVRIKQECETYLKSELKLVFSKWRIAKIKSGVNFVGFRTWQHKRYIRKRSLKSFWRAIKHRNIRALQSILAHARHTSSYSYLIYTLIERLPFKYISQFGGAVRHDLFLYHYSNSRTDWNINTAITA